MTTLLYVHNSFVLRTKISTHLYKNGDICCFLLLLSSLAREISGLKILFLFSALSPFSLFSSSRFHPITSILFFLPMQRWLWGTSPVSTKLFTNLLLLVSEPVIWIQWSMILLRRPTVAIGAYCMDAMSIFELLRRILELTWDQLDFTICQVSHDTFQFQFQSRAYMTRILNQAPWNINM